MKKNRIPTAGIFVLLLICSPGLADERSAALIQGCADKRLSIDSFSIEFSLTSVNDVIYEDSCVHSIVDISGGKRRFRQLPSPEIQFPGDVSILNPDDDVVYNYRLGTTSVMKTDLEDAIKKHALELFDPRVFGLTDIMPFRCHVGDFLEPEDARENATSSREMLDGRELWRVHFDTGEIVSDFWIEEPSFRIFRKKLIGSIDGVPTYDIQIDSKYEIEEMEAIPSWVHITRKHLTSGVQHYDRTIQVTKFERVPSFPPETFALKGMDLPLNTDVVDYRIQRRIGYWTGDGLSERTVRREKAEEIEENKPEIESENKPEIKPDNDSWMRILFTASGILVVFVCVILYFRKKRGSTS